MSGGSFYPEYAYCKVRHFAEELEERIDENLKDTDGYGPADLSEEVLDRMRPYVARLQQMAEVMQAIDYLYSGDHGEESFLRKLTEIETEAQ